MSLESNTAVSNTGSFLQLDSLAHTFTYNTNNQLLTDTVTDGGHTYTQTYSYTGSNLTGISQWMLVS